MGFILRIPKLWMTQSYYNIFTHNTGEVEKFIDLDKLNELVPEFKWPDDANLAPPHPYANDGTLYIEEVEEL